MRQRLRTWIPLSITVGAVTLTLLMWWRDYPLVLAVFSGLGTAALTFTTFQTVFRLRQQLEEYRR